MNSKLVTRLFGSQLRSMSSHGHGHAQLPTVTLNDLPSPSGNWQTRNEAVQRRYNAQLATGVALLVGTLLTGKALGLFEFYNDYPEKPAVITSYK